jgi:sterol desaturase/sphingolipid hydroxylase (fatty acid hydroxylase superfamily)
MLAGPLLLVIAAVATVGMYFCFGRKQELVRHAIQNASASILVYALNMLAYILFMGDIEHFAQQAYEALRIPTLPADFWQGHWVIFGAILAIALMDFCDYIAHRFMHTRWGWPSHAAHHSDSYVNAFTSFRIHALEALIMSLTYLVVLTWMQLPALLPFVFTARLLHNIYIHLDLDWDHGPLKYLIASPRFHRWHHADALEARGKNLANLMPIYDVIFGTYYVPGPCNQPMGALSSGLNDKNPVLIWIYPFQAWGRMIWTATAGPLRRVWRRDKRVNEESALR